MPLEWTGGGRAKSRYEAGNSLLPLLPPRDEPEDELWWLTILAGSALSCQYRLLMCLEVSNSPAGIPVGTLVSRVCALRKCLELLPSYLWYECGG